LFFGQLIKDSVKLIK